MGWKFQTPVGTRDRFFLGVTQEEWFAIRHECIKGQTLPNVVSRITFPVNPYSEDMDVLMEIDVPKCLDEGIKIHRDCHGNYYTQGVTTDYILPPAYIRKDLDAHTAELIFP